MTFCGGFPLIIDPPPPPDCWVSFSFNTNLKRKANKQPSFSLVMSGKSVTLSFGPWDLIHLKRNHKRNLLTSGTRVPDQEFLPTSCSQKAQRGTFPEDSSQITQLWNRSLDSSRDCSDKWFVRWFVRWKGFFCLLNWFWFLFSLLWFLV